MTRRLDIRSKAESQNMHFTSLKMLSTLSREKNTEYITQNVKISYIEPRKENGGRCAALSNDA
jgi:hypothetical protein